VYTSSSFGAWQVASIEYTPLKLLSGNGISRKFPHTTSQSESKPAFLSCFAFVSREIWLRRQETEGAEIFKISKDEEVKKKVGREL
jgi:hypothetical protein